MQIFSNLDMIAVFFLYILKSYKEKNLVEWIKAFSTLLRKKLFFVWLQLRVLSEINNEGEIKWTGLALTSKRNIWRIEQRQSSPVQCDQATTLSPDAACRLRNLIVEMISSQLAHKYRGRQTWGWRPSDMIENRREQQGWPGQASNWSSSILNDQRTSLVSFVSTWL